MIHPSNAILEKIVEKVGTPVMVYDEDLLRAKITSYVTNLKSDMFNTRVLYASKSFICKEMAKLAMDCGTGFDAVSGGEVQCLKEAGVKADMVYFHGNNKTYAEVCEFFDFGTGHIVVDNADELTLITAVADEKKVPMNILIRVNPGVEAHTHEFIQTATKDSKFGISIDYKDGIKAMLDIIEGSEYLTFKGFHAHIGSQIFEADAFEGEIAVMAAFIDEVQKLWGITVEELDLGGGFAIKFTDADNPMPVEEVCERIIAACEREITERKLSLNLICIEPGRSIAGDLGHTIYSAGCRKKTASKEFLFIDGGMADNIRPALYDAEYCCTNLSKEDKPADTNYVIAGKCCESGDIIIKNALLPETEPGDLILVYSTGAYGYSMASNYNKLGRPPVVFVSGDNARLVLRRETYADLLALETEENIF